MKRLYLGLLVFACMFFPILSRAQAPRQKAVLTTAQIMKREVYLPPPLNPLPGSGLPVAKHGPQPMGSSANKITAVSPVQLGTSSNAYTILRQAQNQIVSVDSLDIVAFIHRNDISIFGGSNGGLRYDVSTDGGATFNNDIGLINPALTQPARYPQIDVLKMTGGNDPFDAQLVFTGPLLGTSGTGFDGYVVGVTPLVTSGTPTGGTENYIQLGQQTLLPGGLCQSAPGIFWMADVLSSNGSSATGDIFVSRGEYNPTSGDVDWLRSDTIPCNHYTGFNGAEKVIGPNIAFAPNGQTGWVAWLGDLVGGFDSTYSPIFSKTTDCGQTWGAPFELDLNMIPWIKDSLQTLWVDTAGNPASDGRASCAFDFDLTVDAAGNPHLGVVVCSGIDYSITANLTKFLVDVTSPDGGASWAADYISPVLTLRTPDFGTAPNILSMDNNVQVARDLGGCNIFFAWADSDTALVTGNANGIGFGESDNLAPNLRIAAKNVSTGMQTYPHLVTDLDLLWDGNILFPTMAPIVRSTASGWSLPIVTATMSGNDPLNPAAFWYFGNDATIPNSGWCSPFSMQLSWPFFGDNSFVSPCSGTVTTCNAPIHGPCVVTAVAEPGVQGVTLGDAFPNPALGSTRIVYTLPAAMDARLTLHNALGQELSVLSTGEQTAGEHAVVLPTQSLPAGMYIIRLGAGEQHLSKRLLVVK